MAEEKSTENGRRDSVHPQIGDIIELKISEFGDFEVIGSYEVVRNYDDKYLVVEAKEMRRAKKAG